MNVFQSLKSSGAELNSVVYNTVLDAGGRVSSGCRAMLTFQDMLCAIMCVFQVIRRDIVAPAARIHTLCWSPSGLRGMLEVGEG